MFQFMKNTLTTNKEERNRKKREQQQLGKSLTADELSRLEEARCSLLEKQGITKDSRNIANVTGSVNSSQPAEPEIKLESHSHAPLTIRTVASSKISSKKGILKDKSNYGGQIPNHGVRGCLDDIATLKENTLANEILSGRQLEDTMNPDNFNNIASFDQSTLSTLHELVPTEFVFDDLTSTISTTSIQTQPSLVAIKIHESDATFINVTKHSQCPTDKGYDDIDLELPCVSTPVAIQPRELLLKRQSSSGFGFLLRESVILERGMHNGSECRRTVILAEPVPGKATNTGLLPGDRLIEVDDVNVESRLYEYVMKLIESNSETVRLKV